MDLKPILYGSNQMLVDENLVLLGERYHIYPRHDLYQTISMNTISGCTMVMNSAMRKEIIKEERTLSEKTLDLRIHDTWCMIVANIVGVFTWDMESSILYRQHSNNVVGARQKTKMEVIKDKLYRLKSQKYKGARSRMAREVLEIFCDELSAEEQEDLEDVANCQSFKGAIRLIRNQKLRPVFSESTAVLFLKAVLGWI